MGHISFIFNFSDWNQVNATMDTDTMIESTPTTMDTMNESTPMTSQKLVCKRTNDNEVLFRAILLIMAFISSIIVLSTLTYYVGKNDGKNIYNEIHVQKWDAHAFRADKKIFPTTKYAVPEMKCNKWKEEHLTCNTTYMPTIAYCKRIIPDEIAPWKCIGDLPPNIKMVDHQIVCHHYTSNYQKYIKLDTCYLVYSLVETAPTLSTISIADEAVKKVLEVIFSTIIFAVVVIIFFLVLILFK